MIGYYSRSQPEQNFLFRMLYPRNGRFIALVGRWADRSLVREAKKCFRGATQVESVSYSGPVAAGADLSDHLNYWGQGYPAFMVTDTAFLRNPNYHSAGDTANTLDYQRMAGVVDGVLNTVLHLANSDAGSPAAARLTQPDQSDLRSARAAHVSDGTAHAPRPDGEPAAPSQRHDTRRDGSRLVGRCSRLVAPEAPGAAAAGA
jgi:hypothetical protein